MNIFFSGIGGVGIGPLAEIAYDAGYKVQGSDRNDSPIVENIRKRGISVNIGQDGSYLKSCHDTKAIDWFIYTAATPTGHPELVLAKELGIKIGKRDQLLSHIIREKKLRLLAIAGSHGKTTTTSMVIWTMQQLGIPISYSVGATLKFGPSGKYDPKSDYFIYECDEFDRNFLNFTPYVSIITSIGYDHPDTYPTEKDYLNAFKTFIQQSGKIISWDKDLSILSTNSANTIALHDDIDVLQEMPLVGLHNRRNASLVQKMMEYLGFNSDSILKELSLFPGSGRRFEKLYHNIYSDYGHHPDEIEATLQLARELSDHISLVYQPHQNVRQHEVKDQYTDCFDKAEKIYWVPTYLSREDPSLSILSPEELSKNITNKDALTIANLDDDLWNQLMSDHQKGNLILLMGAGNIDSWARDHIE